MHSLDYTYSLHTVSSYRMELLDDGKSATITALFELPGLGPDQVLLDVVDGRLVVQGERRPLRVSAATPERAQASIEASGPSQIQELKYGTFRRAISVPAGCTVSSPCLLTPAYQRESSY